MADIKGRPKQAVIQEKNIGFYVTWKQYAVITKKAEEAHVNISDYMRQMAINGYVKAKWTGEEREMVRRLVGLAGDIHLLVQKAREAGVEEIALEFLKGRDMMDEIIKRLCDAR